MSQILLVTFEKVLSSIIIIENWNWNTAFINVKLYYKYIVKGTFTVDIYILKITFSLERFSRS